MSTPRRIAIVNAAGLRIENGDSRLAKSDCGPWATNEPSISKCDLKP